MFCNGDGVFSAGSYPSRGLAYNTTCITTRNVVRFALRVNKRSTKQTVEQRLNIAGACRRSGTWLSALYSALGMTERDSVTPR